MALDTPARLLEQPVLERPSARVVVKVADVFCHGDDGFLDYILRFGVIQTSLSRDTVDQSPVGVEELLPPGMIIPRPDAFQQAPTGGEGLALNGREARANHGCIMPACRPVFNAAPPGLAFRAIVGVHSATRRQTGDGGSAGFRRL